MRAPVAIAAVLALATAGDKALLEPIGRLDHEPIREASGMVRSGRDPEVFWVVNDSGNAATLYAVRRDGSLVREFPAALPALDWEDLALGPDGRLYIGDIGNNTLALPLRAVYGVDEPDPGQPATGPLKAAVATYYRAPRGGRFDAEGLYIDRGQAVIVAKYQNGREAELFGVPLDPPAPLVRPAVPRSLGQLAGCTEPVTGAALSNDRLRLAVCSYNIVRVFRRPTPDAEAWAPLAILPFAEDGRQIEAVCWDGDDLMLAGESRGLFRIAARRWKQAATR